MRKVWSVVIVVAMFAGVPVLSYSAALIGAQPAAMWLAHRFGYQGSVAILARPIVVLVARLSALAGFVLVLDAARPPARPRPTGW